MNVRWIYEGKNGCVDVDPSEQQKRKKELTYASNIFGRKKRVSAKETIMFIVVMILPNNRERTYRCLRKKRTFMVVTWFDIFCFKIEKSLPSIKLAFVDEPNRKDESAGWSQRTSRNCELSGFD